MDVLQRCGWHRGPQFLLETCSFHRQWGLGSGLNQLPCWLALDYIWWNIQEGWTVLCSDFNPSSAIHAANVGWLQPGARQHR